MTESVRRAASGAAGHGPIYARLLAACTSYEPAGPWEGLAGGGVYRGPADPDAALASLRAEFPEAALAAAGVLVRSPDGGAALARTIAGADRLLVPLRSRPDAEPFSVLAEAGELCRPGVPTLAPFDDATPSADPALLLAFSMADVATLRAAGFRAAPAAGWEAVTIHALRPLLRQLGYLPVGRSTSDSADAGAREWPTEEKVRRDVIFVAWSPSSLTADPPPGIEAVRRRLAELRDDFDFDLEHVLVWTPAPKTLERIRLYVRERDWDGLRPLIAGDMEELATLVATGQSAARPVFESTPPAAGPNGNLGRAPAAVPPVAAEDGYEAAAARLREVRRNGNTDAAFREAWSGYEDAVDRDLVAPLVRAGLAAGDPAARARSVAAAEVFRTALLGAVLAGDRFTRSVATFGPERCERVPGDELRRLLDAANRAERLCEARTPGTAKTGGAKAGGAKTGGAPADVAQVRSDVPRGATRPTFRG